MVHGFNLPDFDWENGSVTSHRYLLEISDLAIKMSAECGFSQIVNFAIRSQGPNILDLFFISHPSLVQQCTPLHEIYDHCAILTTTKLKITNQKSAGYKVYFWKQANEGQYQQVFLTFITRL